MIDKFIGSLLGTAVGNILGAGIEGYSREKIIIEYKEERDFLPSICGYWCYTDDTERTQKKY